MNIDNKLCLIGYWKDTRLSFLDCFLGLFRKSVDQIWLHPRWLIDPEWQKKNRSAIIRYLKEGVFCGGECGYSYCRFQDGPPNHEMGSGMRTDGVWCWPEGLAVYVERYFIRLPDEFAEHMIRNNFIIPECLFREDPNNLYKLEYTLDFWNQWCINNRPSLGQRFQRLFHLGR